MAVVRAIPTLARASLRPQQHQRALFQVYRSYMNTGLYAKKQGSSFFNTTNNKEFIGVHGYTNKIEATNNQAGVVAGVVAAECQHAEVAARLSGILSPSRVNYSAKDFTSGVSQIPEVETAAGSANKMESMRSTAVLAGGVGLLAAGAASGLVPLSSLGSSLGVADAGLHAANAVSSTATMAGGLLPLMLLYPMLIQTLIGGLNNADSVHMAWVFLGTTLILSELALLVAFLGVYVCDCAAQASLADSYADIFGSSYQSTDALGPRLSQACAILLCIALFTYGAVLQLVPFMVDGGNIIVAFSGFLVFYGIDAMHELLNIQKCNSLLGSAIFVHFTHIFASMLLYGYALFVV